MDKGLKKYLIGLLVVACIFINYGLKLLAVNYSFPFWMDGIGTAVVAYYLGPFCGAVVGATTNILYGFIEPITYFFALISILMGMIIGYCGEKRFIKSWFQAGSVGMMLALVASIATLPFNCIVNDGVINNKWGDGIFMLLKEWNIPWPIASFVGELFVEYLDKMILMTILYFVIIIVEGISNNRKKKAKKLVNTIGAGLILILGVLAGEQAAYAETEEIDYNKYIQFMYTNDNGLLSGEANDIVETKDGILWIGTYAGLYRYNGAEFQYMHDLETVKNANCLYVDEEGRLWIGTNDGGVSICINGEISNTLDQTQGLPTNSVRSVVQQSSGKYFIGTADELAVVTLSGGMRIVDVIDDVTYAQSLTADDNNHIVAVTSAGRMYLIDGLEIVDDKEQGYSSAKFCEDGLLYAGRTDGKIDVFEAADNSLKQKKTIDVSKTGEINSIYQLESGQLIVCAESGAAYINKDHTVTYLNLYDFSSKIDHVYEDYQGNLWFSSSRCGILKLCSSPFSELYIEAGMESKVANTVAIWKDYIYVGTDTGLDIIDKVTMSGVTDELTEELEGVRIRCVRVDSNNNLWICTYNKGIIKLEADGGKKVFDNDKGLKGSKYRLTYECSDGSIAVAGDEGVYFIKDDKIIGHIGADEGLNNGIILCMLEDKDGRLLIGTDGGGINVANGYKIESYVRKTDGIGSDVILRLVQDKSSSGIYVITSNCISYLDEENADRPARVLKNFPYNNNYDIFDDGEGKLFVTGSAGIYVVDKKELLSGEKLEYELLNSLNGLRGVLTANSWNYVDKDNIWYIANGNGVSRLNLNEYQSRVRSYRMLVGSYVVDGTKYFLERDSDIVIPRGATRFEIYPEIINYSTRDPYVCYYIEGIDQEQRVVRQSELSSIVYSNLPGGTYRFILAVKDDDMQNNIEEHIYTIIKKNELYDNWWFKFCFFLELVFIISWITLFITKSVIQRTIDIQKKQIALANEQIKMGNETILAIAKTVDAKDSNTSQHSTRVSEYSVKIARKLGYSEEKLENLRKMALLHDIGKIGIPDRVLNKPGKLDDEEYAIMKSHVVMGGEILKDFTLVDNVQDAAMYHHERWDGKGYMKGLKGEEIPEAARIVGIADAFDAMTANRVYRKQLDFDFVLGELKRCRGTQFDPKMVDIMLELIDSGEIDVEAIYRESRGEQKESGGDNA